MGKLSDIDISVANIWQTWRNFRTGKRASRAILEYEWRLADNLLDLQRSLVAGEYEHGPYDHFIVSDSKRRDIAVAGVRDRVVHRLLYDYLVPICDTRFDYDVWSCRIGKGNVAALERAKELLRRHDRSYVWRGDVYKFFDSINHFVMKDLLQRYKLGPAAHSLLEKVIASHNGASTRRGLPIGNLTSQILANVYLHEFDFFVRNTLKPLAYVRYGDDFILLADKYQSAKNMQQSGKEFLAERLCLIMHPRNNVVVPSCQGIRFLGVAVYANGTTLPLRAFRRIEDRMTALNYTSYLMYVQRYGNRKQQLRVGLSSDYLALAKHGV